MAEQRTSHGSAAHPESDELRWADVSGEILINRPVEQVFDFVADQRNEPIYKPANGAVGEDHGGADRGRHCDSHEPQCRNRRSWSESVV
jgi:hypothetical protein